MSEVVSPCPQFKSGFDTKNDACKECCLFFENEYETCRMYSTGETKWGHKLGTKSGMIDIFIIRGSYTVSEIESEIANKLGKCRKYSVREHLSHLRKRHGINANVGLDKTVRVIKENE